MNYYTLQYNVSCFSMIMNVGESFVRKILNSHARHVTPVIAVLSPSLLVNGRQNNSELVSTKVQEVRFKHPHLEY